MGDAVERKVLAIRERLAAIDERFRADPQQHPFAEKVQSGSASIPELLAIAENTAAEVAKRCLALDALGSLCARFGIDDSTAARLGALGTRTDQHPSIRAEAGRALARSGHEPFLRAFLGRLAADNAELVSAAAHAMGVARYRPAVPALIELFAKNDSPEVCERAAWALGEIGDTSAVDILEAAFKAEKAIAPAVQALGKLGSQEQLPLLTVGLRDSSAEVRAACAEAMAAIIGRHRNVDHSALAPYLLHALEREEDPLVGVLLIAALGRIGTKVPPSAIRRVLGVDVGGTVVKGYVARLLSLKSEELS